jgi:DNA-binding response OmpR family regulator
MSNSTKILIIEDSPADVALIEAYLRDVGFKHQLYKSASLSEGLKKLQEHQPDLVLLDLQLHGLEGGRTVQLLSEEAPDVPVVVLTGGNNEIIGIQSVWAGAQGFLVKGDFDARTLVQTIRYALQRFEEQFKWKQKAERPSNDEQPKRTARFGRWEMDIVTYAMKWDNEMFNCFELPPNSISPSLLEYLKYVHVEDRQKVERLFEEAVNDGQLHSLIHRVILSNTKVKRFQVNAKMNYDEEANRLVLLGSIQDITDQQHFVTDGDGNGQDESSHQHRKGKSFAQSLSSLFTINLRTPTASLANLLYLLEETDLDARQQRYVDGIKRALDDFNFALDNWMNVAEGTEGRSAHINMLEFISSIEKRAAERARKSYVALLLNVSKKMPDLVNIDQKKVAQIVYNLVEAGVSFCAPGNELQLSFGTKGKRHEDLQLLVRAKFESNTFDHEEASLLLEDQTPFKKKLVPSSQYLPLPVAARIAESLNGKVELSQLSSSRFSLHVTLPLEIASADPIVVPSKPERPISILLVEDHDLHRLATQRMLEQWSDNIEVVTVNNGEEAVKKALLFDFDVILMDLQMPILSGIEAAIKIRQSSDALIIALTADGSKQEYDYCRMIGVNGYLVKPIAPELLFSTIMKNLYAASGKP